MQSFIQGLDVPEDAKQRLLGLTPSAYTGMAQSLASADED
jgi:adenylosuccinate lyase